MDQILLEKIKRHFQASREIYGSVRIHQALKTEGEVVGIKRVRRLMQENNLEAKRNKLFKVTTQQNPNNQVADNLLAQDFTADKPNQKWVSDITYVWTLVGWLYVAVIMDLFSRKIIGLAMNKTMKKELVLEALEQAIKKRGRPEECIYHSDRGSQYTSDDFQQRLADYSIKASMSGKGHCYDNAAMESFFATLKTECIYHQHYKTREEAELSIFDYTEIFYNNQRQHSYLDYVSPKFYEEQYYQRNKNLH